MERKIGEVFECQGKKYKVVENKGDEEEPIFCDSCAFDKICISVTYRRGFCHRFNREDRKDVYFIEVKE